MQGSEIRANYPADQVHFHLLLAETRRCLMYLDLLTNFLLMFPFDPPALLESIDKLKLLWCFNGNKNETAGRNSFKNDFLAFKSLKVDEHMVVGTFKFLCKIKR